MIDHRKRCPTCRQALPHPAPDIRLSPQQRHVLNIIRKAGDNGIDTDELVELAYRGAKLPKTADKVMHVTVCTINKRLRPKGYRIRNLGRAVGRGGGSLKGYYFYTKLEDGTCA